MSTKKTFQKVKRLYNLGRHVCASGTRNNCTDETMGGGGWSQFIRLFVFPVCEAVSNSSPGGVHVFADVFVYDCVPDTRHNYLVIFVEILILVLQQVLHRLLAIATDEREKRENIKKVFLTAILKINMR